MKTYVGMSYDQWREANNVKSDEQQAHERTAWRRDALEGLTNREVIFEEDM